MSKPENRGELVYRQSGWTRLTHWLWAISLFFLLLTGLQIFNAHPALYVGDQSGFQFDNQVLAIGSLDTGEKLQGVTEIFGARFDTTGVLGLSQAGRPGARTCLSGLGDDPVEPGPRHGPRRPLLLCLDPGGTLRCLAGRQRINGHLKRDLAPRIDDLRRLPGDIAAHARLRFHHTRDYNTLQKLTYAAVLFVLLPLMILTGLAMSPA